MRWSTEDAPHQPRYRREHGLHRAGHAVRRPAAEPGPGRRHRAGPRIRAAARGRSSPWASASARTTNRLSRGGNLDGAGSFSNRPLTGLGNFWSGCGASPMPSCAGHRGPGQRRAGPHHFRPALQDRERRRAGPLSRAPSCRDDRRCAPAPSLCRTGSSSARHERGGLPLVDGEPPWPHGLDDGVDQEARYEQHRPGSAAARAGALKGCAARAIPAASSPPTFGQRVPAGAQPASSRSGCASARASTMSASSTAAGQRTRARYPVPGDVPCPRAGDDAHARGGRRHGRGRRAVGVQLTVKRLAWDANVLEFVAIGTGVVHAEGSPAFKGPKGQPFTSDLPARISGRCCRCRLPPARDGDGLLRLVTWRIAAS